MGKKKNAVCSCEETMSEITKQLAHRLRKLLDDDGFVFGTLNCVHNEEHQKTLLSYMDQGEDVTVSSVAVLAFKLSCQDAKTVRADAS